MNFKFVWCGKLTWKYRIKSIRFALKNLVNALKGYELTIIEEK
jgi:hypothetical protein